MIRRGSRSPRKRNVRRSKHSGEYGYRGPQVLSPRAPTNALGAPPRALTPCWRPIGEWQADSLKLSPLQDLKARRRASRIFSPGINETLTSDLKDSNTLRDRERHVKHFLDSGKESVSVLLPNLKHLQLSRDQVAKRIATARNFSYVMEKLRVQRLHERIMRGSECRNLVDPSAKA